MAAQQAGAPPLACIALEALARNIQGVHSLATQHVLPEELALALFTRVIELGKLNLRVLDMFERDCGDHERLAAAIAGLGITRWTPPLLKTTRGGPLGYTKPPWE